MAGLYGAAYVTDAAVTGGTPIGVLALFPPDANSRAKLLKLIVSTDGTNSANTPIRVDLCRGSSGTWTNTSVSPIKMNDPTGTGETLRFKFKTANTAAPTQLEILETYRLPAFGGTIVEPYAPGQEPICYGSGTPVYLYVLITAAQTINITCTMHFEE